MTAAVKIERDTVSQEVATITQVTGRSLRAMAGASEVLAERATSCLTPPAPGDTVLLATSASGRSWVLAVLERPSTETTIAVDGDLAIRAGGRLDLGARQGVSLTSAGEIAATAAALQLCAVDADVAVERITVVGRYLSSELERVKSFAKTFDGVFERLSQRVQRSFRRVEEVDQLDAGHIDYRAGGLASLRSQSAVVSAEELVKLDGGQIHLG
jgi:hypothetical protein